MDFKVAGTSRGITGIQLDLKIDGINEEIIRETLDQAREARLRDPQGHAPARSSGRARRSQPTPRG